MKYDRTNYSALTKINGMTLVEVLIAMTILAVGLLSMGKLVGVTLGNNVTGHTISRATLLAQDKIEALKLQTIDTMKDLCHGSVPEKIDTIFERRCLVDRSYSDRANIIEVTVSWQRQGQTRDVVLKTLTLGDGS